VKVRKFEKGRRLCIDKVASSSEGVKVRKMENYLTGNTQAYVLRTEPLIALLVQD